MINNISKLSFKKIIRIQTFPEKVTRRENFTVSLHNSRYKDMQTGFLVGYPKVELEVTYIAYLSDHGSSPTMICCFNQIGSEQAMSRLAKLSGGDI